MKITDIQSYYNQNSIQSSSVSASKDNASVKNTQIAESQRSNTEATFRKQIDLFDLQPKPGTLYTKPQQSVSNIGVSATSVSKPELEDFSIPNLLSTPTASNPGKVTPLISRPETSSINKNNVNGLILGSKDMSGKIIISDENMDGFLKNAFKVFDSPV